MRSDWGLFLDSLVEEAARWRRIRIKKGTIVTEWQEPTEAQRREALEAEVMRLRQVLEQERTEHQEQERSREGFRRETAFHMARELRPDLMGKQDTWQELREVADAIYGWLTGAPVGTPPLARMVVGMGSTPEEARANAERQWAELQSAQAAAAEEVGPDHPELRALAERAAAARALDEEWMKANNLSDGPGWQPSYTGPRASDDPTVEERDLEERR
jgi:hypothetical protein